MCKMDDMQSECRNKARSIELEQTSGVEICFSYFRLQEAVVRNEASHIHLRHCLEAKVQFMG